MARRGRICEMKRKFEDYDYVILGVGGIGKTTLAYELGKKITGSDEGTFIITFAVSEHNNYGYAKIKVIYDGTDYKIEEIINYVSGGLGNIKFNVSNGYLKSSSWVATTFSYVTASINIDNINYIV